MSENKIKKLNPPKIIEPIEGAVPSCPECGQLFAEPVAANMTWTCPACNKPFIVKVDPKTHEKKEPETKPSEE